ncbi:MAG: hypothetical protein JWO95_3456 [Verrucomicrobiales bacterium]|nr:hypothetical protein [Verrucomicrobiales bacterium]
MKPPGTGGSEMKKRIPLLCWSLAIVLAVWTAFAQAGTAVGFMVSGSLGNGGEAVYSPLIFWLAVWSTTYFLGLCVLTMFCRAKTDRTTLFRMAIVPIFISHLWFAFRGVLPGFAWILTMGVLVALAATAIFAIGSFFPQKQTNEAGGISSAQ